MKFPSIHKKATRTQKYAQENFQKSNLQRRAKITEISTQSNVKFVTVPKLSQNLNS